MIGQEQKLWAQQVTLECDARAANQPEPIVVRTDCRAQLTEQRSSELATRIAAAQQNSQTTPATSGNQTVDLIQQGLGMLQQMQQHKAQ